MPDRHPEGRSRARCALVERGRANKPQQVNNGQGVVARAGETEKVPNELLEGANAQRLDDAATRGAVGANPELATVGALNGSEHPGRQGTGRT